MLIYSTGPAMWSIGYAMREAAAAPLASLLAQYKADLSGRGLAAEHVKATVARIERIVSALKWKRLADVRPDSFVAWRSRQTFSAKTKKEYQTSANAFFNWLVRMGKMTANPLAKVDRVDIRGKAVRKSRAFTVDEFAKLCKVAPAGRRLAYLFLVYTGARKNEVAALRWSDLNLGEKPAVLFRSETTKDKDSRPVPLKPELAALLREANGKDSSGVVFAPFPSDDALHADLRRAGIERKDATGRVLHFHAFRKTFQTWGAVAGIGQRSAQEMLGHSDPSLTAGVYTDVAALQLHSEVAKLPWVGAQSGVAIDAQKCARIATPSRFRGLLAELIELAKDVLPEGEKTDLPASLIGCPTWIRTMTR
jgi:integrase